MERELTQYEIEAEGELTQREKEHLFYRVYDALSISFLFSHFKKNGPAESFRMRCAFSGGLIRSFRKVSPISSFHELS
jgi:hypothetical protein